MRGVLKKPVSLSEIKARTIFLATLRIIKSAGKFQLISFLKKKYDIILSKMKIYMIKCDG